MYTIQENSSYEYEIKKSRFITLLYPISHINEVNSYLTEAKNTYKDASHYCYAYKLGQTQRFSDDKEPSGTAGLPMMEVLNKKNLDHILCIVVRYFGGIKLGAGGLVRAYGKAVRDAIEHSQIVELVKGYLIHVTIEYDNQKQFDYLYKNWIIKKEFKEKVIYELEMEEEKLKELQNSNYSILKYEEIWFHSKK